MPLTVKFVTGEERQYDADTASLDGHLFVLKKWTGRRLESGKVFDADQVVMALLKNGDIVLGKGKRKID